MSFLMFSPFFSTSVLISQLPHDQTRPATKSSGENKKNTAIVRLTEYEGRRKSVQSMNVTFMERGEHKCIHVIVPEVFKENVGYSRTRSFRRKRRVLIGSVPINETPSE